MKEITRILIIFFLVCGIVFFSYNIYSYMNGNTDNFFSIAMSNSGKKNIIGTLIEDNVKLEDSGVKGDKYDFNSLYNPYYSFLSSDGKKLYKQIYANASSYKETFVPVVDMKVDDVLEVIESVINDHPELFWLSNTFSYRYNNKNICRQITLSFNGTQNDAERFNKYVDEIVNNAKKLGTVYEKELYVHDVLMELVEYDSNAPNNQSAYSAIVNHRTVCAGYARAFQYIMMHLGIPTYYVTGVSEGEDHAWNIVKIGNEYYNVDVTWDDELRDSHTLFNKTDEEFSKSHRRSPLSSKLAKCNYDTYSYKNSEEEEYSYHYVSYE